MAERRRQHPHKRAPRPHGQVPASGKDQLVDQLLPPGNREDHQGQRQIAAQLGHGAIETLEPRLRHRQPLQIDVHAASPLERAVVPDLQPQYDWDLCITRVSLAALLLFWSLARPTPQETSFDDGAMGSGETAPRP